MNNQCHGCKGNGWVSPNGNNAVLCPVCEGQGVFARKTQPEPFVKDPFTIKPYKLPSNPFQPNPYFYGPSITCNITGVETPESTVNRVMDKLNKSMKNFKSTGVICKP